MKLHEAVQRAQKEGKWFRPVTWEGTGYAYTVRGGNTCLVPSPRSGDVGMTSSVDVLTKRWVVVSQNEVMGERE